MVSEMKTAPCMPGVLRVRMEERQNRPQSAAPFSTLTLGRAERYEAELVKVTERAVMFDYNGIFSRNRKIDTVRHSVLVLL